MLKVENTLNNSIEKVGRISNSGHDQYRSRILIVEDTAIQAKKLKFFLEKMGYEVVWSLNGKEALAELEKTEFELVITDVQMPEMDGLEMLSRIRNNSKFKKIPVIVITTLDTDDACERSIALGADDFVAKPFKPREIGLRINNIVTKRRAEYFAKMQLQAIESSIDGMSILSSDGQYMYVNDAQVKVFGYVGHDDIVGNNWEMLYPEDEVKRLKEEILPEFRRNKKWIGEIAARRMDGSIYQQEMSLSEIDDGKFISICRDISERKRQQKEKEELRKKVYMASRLASIGGLAAGVAHEINNPLTILVGYLKRLQKIFNEQNYERDKCLLVSEKLGVTVNRILKILGGLKIYSKLDSDLKMGLIDVNKEIANAIEMVKEGFQQQQINLEINLTASNAMVVGDGSRLGHVIMNLLANARDALEGKNAGLVKVETKNNSEKDKVIFSITDNGCGISDANREKIFDAFFTTRPIGKGTGLGLSICYAVIDEMKGSIDVISKEGEGSTFMVTIPSKIK